MHPPSSTRGLHHHRNVDTCNHSGYVVPERHSELFVPLDAAPYPDLIRVFHNIRLQLQLYPCAQIHSEIIRAIIAKSGPKRYAVVERQTPNVLQSLVKPS